MKIVVLDAHTINPGDLSWDELRSIGTCQIYDRTFPSDVPSQAADAEILLVNKVQLKRQQLLALPKATYIGVLATGTNVVDLAAARERGIVVTNVPAYATPSVAQLTFALLLELTHHAAQHSSSVRQGDWARSDDFCYWLTPLVELSGRTLGIIGFGNLGQAVAKIASALNMPVIAYTPRPRQPPPPGIAFVALETVFRTSDVVSLHCPLTSDTRHLVNKERLSKMKPTAFLLNTARGGLVDETALAEALNHGRIAGAGLDVLSTEPPDIGNPLVAAKNCIITPHLAWASMASRSRLMKTAIQNVRAFLAGKPQNVVN